MPDRASIATWDVLQDFGFTADSSVLSDAMRGLSYHFGNFKLLAYSLTNKRFVDVVMFFGILTSPRRIAEVEFEMPRFVESREQCAAWIVWNLDQHADGRVFQPTREAAWLLEGRNHKHLLPWQREQEEYRVRPHCTARREWMKLALKTLAHHLAEVEDTEPVVIGFDGKVLLFRVSDNLVALAAEGSSWMSHFSLPAEKLRSLPKRLMRANVDVSVWRSRLNIDRFRYDGIVETAWNPKQGKDS